MTEHGHLVVGEHIPQIECNGRRGENSPAYKKPRCSSLYFASSIFVVM